MQNERQETAGDGDEQKVKLIDLMKSTAFAMMGKEQGSAWDAFPYQLLIVKNDTADPIFYKLTAGNVLTRVSKDAIAATTIKYWQRCKATAGYRLMPPDAKTTLEFFAAFASSFDEKIEPVLFASDIGYCFRRLPFDPKPGQTPTFDELMHRTTNAQALKGWIGSLFDNNSERQQYLWVYGDGMNGKSSLARFLQNIFHEGATSAQPPGRGGDRFWSAQFLGKRLAILPDCNDYSFVNSGMFKSHTGDDYISIEEKNRGVYSALPTWKFLILSNQRPSIEGEASAVRRAIYCEMGAITKRRLAANTYQALLNSEAPAFIAQCLEAYKQLAPDGGAIETDAAITEALVSAAEERWGSILNTHLFVYPEEDFKDIPYKDLPCVSPHYMRRIQKIENLGPGQYQQFLNFLARTYNVTPHMIKSPSGPRRLYVRCKERGAVNEIDMVGNGSLEVAGKLLNLRAGSRSSDD